MPLLKDLLTQRQVKESLKLLFVGQMLLATRTDPVLFDRGIRSGLENTILQALGELPGCSIDDICDVWYSQFPELEPGHDWEPKFNHFFDVLCESLHKLTLSRWRSDPILLSPRGAFETQQYPATELLWESADQCYQVELLGCLPAGFRMFGENQHADERVLVQLHGRCSERFFKVFCDHVTSAVSALLDGILTLNAQWLFDQTNKEPLNRVSPTGLNIEPDRIKRFHDGLRLWKPIEPSPGDVEENETLPCPTFQLLTAALSAVFSDVSTRKDSIERRVKNSVRLFIEAKRQSQNAVGLALSVSAIEALICRKGDNVAQMFAENMAVLLEPDIAFRAAAERWCKSLYDKRSGVLHGSAIGCCREDCVSAEIAAIAALKAIVERRAGVRRVGGDFDNPEALLKEFRDGKYASGHPMFVDETPINRIWRSVGTT